MKNIIDIYEASLLDIEGTIEDGDLISDFNRLMGKLTSSSSEKEFNDNLNKLVINIKATFKKFEADDFKQYYSGKFDRSQIFIAVIKNTNSHYEQFKDQLNYCDSNKSGKLFWNEEQNFESWSGPVNTKGIILSLKQYINNYCKIYDFYMVPECIHNEFINLMKKREVL